jgi:hypothetical protein
MAFATLEERILGGNAFPLVNDTATIATVNTTTVAAANLSATTSARIPTRTVAQLPTAAAGNVGQIAYVSNGAAGNPCLAVSTQTGETTFAWKVVLRLDNATTAAAE